MPNRIRPRKGPPALCLTHSILLYIRVGIWLSVELYNIELSGVETALMVPCKRCIETNRVSPSRRDNSCSVEEASNSKGGALGEDEARL